MSRLTRGPPFSGAAVAFIGRRMSTLLLLAFEVAPLSKDACNPPVQSPEPCGPSQMGQKGGEVNCSGGFATQETPDLRPASELAPIVVSLRHPSANNCRYKFHSQSRVDKWRRALVPARSAV